MHSRGTYRSIQTHPSDSLDHDGHLTIDVCVKFRPANMKWGIVFASTTFPEPDRAIAMAQAAEAAGFDSLWCPEHVVVAVAEGATPYSGSLDGKMDRLWRRGGIPDPLVWLAFVASQTSTIALGTNVVIVPEHQPAVLAKSVATLDALSGGRVMLGIGVGELPEEYAAVGMEFTDRGSRMDEYIEAMRALWQDEVATYHGKHIHFDQVRSDPSPTRGTVPLHIGGASPAAIRRTAKYGDGYFPWVPPTLDLHTTLRQVIRDVRAEAELIGRDPDEIEYTVGGARGIDEAEAMGALGVDRLVIAIHAKDIGEVQDELARFGDEVIAATRDL
jgi:probable F420-dependent oxidoreductase